MKKKFLLLLFFLVFFNNGLFPSGSFLFAAEFISKTTEEKLSIGHGKMIASQLAELKKSISVFETQQRKVMSAIFDLNQKLKKIEKERTQINEQKDAAEASTSFLAEKVLGITHKIENQKKRLKKRVIALYKIGGQGVLRFLASAKSASAIEKNIKMLGLISKQDKYLIDNYKINKTQFEIQRRHFLVRMKQLNKIALQLKEKEKEIVFENEKKMKIFVDVRNSKNLNLNELVILRNKLKDIPAEDSEFIRLLIRPSFFEQKGNLALPVQRFQFLEKFGLVKDNIYQVRWSNKGIFFSLDEGQPVTSVFEGIVSYVGLIDGYGDTVIIDHGDHYYTIYGSNRFTFVKPGDFVKTNQKIAESGKGYKDFKAGLYFELRHFSEPNDPSNWLKGMVL